MCIKDALRLAVLARNALVARGFPRTGLPRLACPSGSAEHTRAAEQEQMLRCAIDGWPGVTGLAAAYTPHSARTIRRGGWSRREAAVSSLSGKKDTNLLRPRSGL